MSDSAYSLCTLGNFKSKEKHVKFKIIYACAVFAFALATTTSAQTKNSFSGKCENPDVAQSIPAGDADGHTFSLASAKCTATGDVNGVAAKDGVYAEHQDVTAKQVKAWGVYVESFENGDKIFYNYQSVLPDKAPARNKYQITGGTGKMKGIKGSGTCKLDAGTHACIGEYTIAAPATAKN
jgi:hypothetical protein